MATISANSPLKDIDEWDDFLTGRYQEGKTEEQFRQYDAQANPGVAEFYRLNHQYQTFDYVMAKEKEYFGLNKGQMSIWEAAEFSQHLSGRQRSRHRFDADRTSPSDIGGDS